MAAHLDSEAMAMEMEFGAEFTLAEAIEMKRVYDKMGKACPDAPFYQDLADKFNNSVNRSGKSLIKWEQVHDWFQDLRSMELQTQMKSVEAEVVKVSDERVSAEKVSNEKVSAVKVSDVRVSVGKGKEIKNQLPQSPNIGSSHGIQRPPKTKAAAAAELSGLRYEAKSSKDLAWYDVGLFLTHRHTASGELLRPFLHLCTFHRLILLKIIQEARVRFAKFGQDQDEWVNVKTCVRQRSLPVEASECQKVKVGDLVMCFRECEDDAVYRDAHVLGIERNKHDENQGCTCIFLVRFDHDSSKDRVRLSNLCVRPTSSCFS